MRQQLPAEEIKAIGGLLCNFEARAARALLGLLEGRSIKGAAACAGMGAQSMNHWRNNVPAFAEVFESFRELGFALIYEQEIETRALAGEQDRGSVRLLEMVAKSRGGEDYREVKDINLTHRKGADAAEKVLDATREEGGGWSVKTT